MRICATTHDGAGTARWRAWLALVCLIPMMACAGQDTRRPSVPFAGVNGALVIGHRGGSLEAPENTLAAIRHAIDVGTDWQEIDVTLTADDEVIVIHDDTLERTTNGTGEVAELTLAELRELSAGRPRWSDEARARLNEYGVTPPDFGSRYEGERLPTLAEVLALPGSRLMIEMKQVPENKVERLAANVVDAVAAARAHDRVILGSFEPALLWAANQKDPSLPLIGIAASLEAVRAALKVPLKALAVRLDLIEETLRTAPKHVAVWGWTAYSPEMAEAAVMHGAHGVITDVPRAVLARLRPEPELRVRP